MGVGGGECLLLATQLLTQNFFQVKLIQPGLEFSTAGLAPPPLTRPPRCLYLLAASTFAKRKLLSLEQEGGEDRRYLFLRPTSRRYGEGEEHETGGILRWW